MAAIPETMKRLVLVKKHHELANVEFRVETVPVPKPRSDEVLVRMVSAPVNASDANHWRNIGDLKEILLEKPEMIGKEGSGIVVASGGEGLGTDLVGKAITLHNTREGTFQEYVCVPAHPALVIPDGIPVENACSAFVNPFTVVAMVETAKERKSPAFIHTGAASALGQMMVRVSKQMNVTVVNVVRKSSQVQLLKTLGAQYIINTSDMNWKEQLKKYIDELNITVAFDALAGEMSGTLMRMLPQFSQVYTYGVLSWEPVSNIDGIDLIYRGKELHGFNLVDWIRNGAKIAENINGTVVRTPSRFHRASKEVMSNLEAGKWAASTFKDCTMETMQKELVESIKGGLTNSKLRMRFGADKMKQEALGSA